MLIGKSSIEVRPNQSLRFLSHKCLLLPGPLLPSTFPCSINCNNGYFGLCITCLKYWNFHSLTICVIALDFPVFLGTLRRYKGKLLDHKCRCQAQVCRYQSQMQEDCIKVDNKWSNHFLEFLSPRKSGGWEYGLHLDQ